MLTDYLQAVRKFLIFLFLAPAALATQYFVTQSGAGTNTGLSLGNAASVAQYNANSKFTATGGDTVSFSGTITSTITTSSSGTGNGAGRLTMDFSGATIGFASGTGNYVDNNSQSFITYSGGGSFNATTGVFTQAGVFTSNGTNGGPPPASGGSGNDGPTIFNFSETGTTCHDITITGNYYNGGTTDATDFIWGGSAQATYVYNLLVTGNYVNNCCHAVSCVRSTCHDITVTNNFFCTSVNALTQTDLISVYDMYNLTITGNVLINRAPNSQTEPPTNFAHNDVIQTNQSGATPNGAPYNIVIAYNWICNDAQNGSTGAGSWMTIEGVTNNGALNAMYVYGNVFISPSDNFGQNNGCTFDSMNGATINFYNNTFISSGTQPNTDFFDFAGGNTGTITVNLENNVAEGINGSPYIPVIAQGTGYTINNNYNWSANLSNTSQWNGTNGTDLGTGVTSDPWFVSFTGTPGSQVPSGYNFLSKTGSALRGAGDHTIGATYNQGIASAAIWPNPNLATRTPAVWDIGAYQFVAVGTNRSLGPLNPTGILIP